MLFSTFTKEQRGHLKAKKKMCATDLRDVPNCMAEDKEYPKVELSKMPPNSTEKAENTRDFHLQIINWQ